MANDTIRIKTSCCGVTIYTDAETGCQWEVLPTGPNMPIPLEDRCFRGNGNLGAGAPHTGAILGERVYRRHEVVEFLRASLGKAQSWDREDYEKALEALGES